MKLSNLVKTSNGVKKLPKILTITFLSILIFQMVCLIILLTIPKKTQAADIRFNPQVEIPGLEEEVQKDGGGYYVGTETEVMKDGKKVKTFSSDLLGKYIQAIYNYAIGIVGILAAVVLMFGGVIWLTAGGSPEKVNEAKAWIGASLSGLVLVLCSYMILNTINPDLVSFKPIEVQTIEKMPVMGCCEYKECDDNITEPDCRKKEGYIAWREGSIYTCNAENKCEKSCFWITLRNDEYCRSIGYEMEGTSEMCGIGQFGAAAYSTGGEFKSVCCCSHGKVANPCEGKKNGDECTTSGGDKGYCMHNACHTCKPAGTTCTQWLYGNKECCNGDCQGLKDPKCN
ncbi:MAG: pilin [Patescibacteria group bacterium]|nr:pilin [Patescibacteria group bacterium]MDD5294414.1 pilin [Patescibacteria group bacterium]MDD5554525.1 pilin [Patescibacteria group bacterium]